MTPQKPSPMVSFKGVLGSFQHSGSFPTEHQQAKVSKWVHLVFFGVVNCREFKAAPLFSEGSTLGDTRITPPSRENVASYAPLQPTQKKAAEGLPRLSQGAKKVEEETAAKQSRALSLQADTSHKHRGVVRQRNVSNRFTVGCGSKPCTPEHRNRWQVDVHPLQNGAIRYAPWPVHTQVRALHSPEFVVVEKGP